MTGWGLGSVTIDDVMCIREPCKMLQKQRNVEIWKIYPVCFESTAQEGL